MTVILERDGVDPPTAAARLFETFSETEQDDGVMAVVLTGAEGQFCAGQARAAAIELAKEIAQFPQRCLRVDRDSAYAGWNGDATQSRLRAVRFRPDQSAAANRRLPVTRSQVRSDCRPNSERGVEPMTGQERRMTRYLRIASIVAALTMAACGKPTVDGLRDSFAEQVKANKFIKDFQRNGDELLFSAPDGSGNPAKWRVHIDSSVVEDYRDKTQPYKGTVKSSWFVNGEAVTPRGRESNLPVELLDNGISQDCWALWAQSTKKWGW